jgi:hypothetical protein
MRKNDDFLSAGHHLRTRAKCYGKIAMKSRIVGAISAAALMTTAPPASAATNLIADGMFSEGATAGSFTTYAFGTYFGPWESYEDLETAYPASVDLVGTYWLAPPGGGYSVDLDGTLNNNGSSGTDSQGSILQFFLVPTTGTYMLKFYVSGNQDGGPTTKQYFVEVRAQASAVDEKDVFYSTNNNAQAGVWSLVTEPISFTAAGPHYLLFGGYGDPTNQFGAVIGDVSLSAVPEPSTWALMLLGFAGLGFAGYRRARARLAPLPPEGP